MGIFEKRGIETIDYTLLQKKGFIKKKEERKLPYKIDNKGNIDMTSFQAIEKQNVTDVNPAAEISNTNDVSPFGFLDNIANAGSSMQTKENDVPLLRIEDKSINQVKLKIDDLEFKLERLMEKLSLIEGKLENFERKLS